MSNNFYNDFQSSFTFHGNAAPPPLFSVPPPCPIYIPPPPPPTSDQDFVKSFEPYITKSNVENPKTDSISTVRGKITNLIKSLDEIKEIESKLQENILTMSDTDWNSHMKDIEDKKANIIRILNIGDLDNVRKLLSKRAVKRLRMKRVKLERSRAKKERMKQMEERSIKIDENLKKIQDDIEKSKQVCLIIKFVLIVNTSSLS